MNSVLIHLQLAGLKAAQPTGCCCVSGQRTCSERTKQVRWNAECIHNLERIWRYLMHEAANDVCRPKNEVRQRLSLPKVRLVRA